MAALIALDAAIRRVVDEPVEGSQEGHDVRSMSARRTLGTQQSNSEDETTRMMRGERSLPWVIRAVATGRRRRRRRRRATLLTGEDDVKSCEEGNEIRRGGS